MMHVCLWQLSILHSWHFQQPLVRHAHTGTEGGGGSGSDADAEAPIKPTKKTGKPAAVPAAAAPEPSIDVSAWDVFGLHPGILRALAMQVCCSSYAAILKCALLCRDASTDRVARNLPFWRCNSCMHLAPLLMSKLHSSCYFQKGRSCVECLRYIALARPFVLHCKQCNASIVSHIAEAVRLCFRYKCEI